MNERIKQLAEQAEDWADNQNFYESDYRNYLMEKFAELIVQECAKIGELKEQGFRDYDPDMSVGWYMRKHFGFE